MRETFFNLRGILLGMGIGVMIFILASLAGCGGNNFTSKNQNTLKTNVKGIYYVSVQTPNGRSVPCFVLSKEFSEGDEHAIGISCNW